MEVYVQSKIMSQNKIGKNARDVQNSAVKQTIVSLYNCSDDVTPYVEKSINEHFELLETIDFIQVIIPILLKEIACYCLALNQ